MTRLRRIWCDLFHDQRERKSDRRSGVMYCKRCNPVRPDRKAVKSEGPC